jgi:probable HAF family extracellular repeat protein
MFSAVLLLGHASAAVQYTVVDLGVLPGSDISEAYGINNRGEVVGRTNYSAFLWRNGLLTNLGPGAAYGINDAGQVVGETSGITHGFLWENGNKTLLDEPSGYRDTYGSARSINNRGVIAGQITTWFPSPRQDRAYVWDHGASIDVGILSGARHSFGRDINDLGQVVGFGYPASSTGPQGFLWQNSTMLWLPLYMAYAINEDGVIAGVAGGNAALWHDGATRNLTLPARRVHSVAYDINDLGMAVGEANNNPGEGYALLWIDGTGYDLNTLIPADSRWLLRSATAINDAGQIVGYGRPGATPSNPIGIGSDHAFLLTPVPEPTLLWLFTGLFVVARRRGAIRHSSHHL